MHLAKGTRAAVAFLVVHCSIVAPAAGAQTAPRVNQDSLIQGPL